MKTKNLFSIFLILAFLLTACGQGTAAPAPVTHTPVATQPPTDIPTLTPLPTLVPLFQTLSPTTPYPTASVVKSNAVAFIAENSLWIANVDGSGERKLVDITSNKSWVYDQMLQWSPDGKWISYFSKDDLWVVSLDGLVNKKVLSAPDIYTFAWSPDSSEIAYIQAMGLQDAPPIRVGLLDLTTGEVSELSSYQSPVSITLSWSPDGRHLLLSKDFSFIVFDVPTRKVVNEIATTGECPSVWYSTLAWSPNGKWFYHTHHGTGGYYSVWICVSGLDGSNRKININGASYPVWDRTGYFLYFAARNANPDNDPNQRLLQYDVRTQEIKRLLPLSGEPFPYQQVWVSISPDGSTLEAASIISENQPFITLLDIKSMTETKFNILAATETRVFHLDTIWSADSQNLIFLSRSNSLLAFYKLNIQTGKTTIFSGEHSIEHWAVSPIATTP